MCLLYLFSIGSQFLDFIRLMDFDLFFYCATVKTIYSMKRLRLLLLPPRREASPLQGYFPALKFSSTHLYTWVERGTTRVKCLALKYNRGLEPGPLAPKSSTLTMRPLRLPAECRNGGNCIQGFHSDQLNFFQITITS